MDEFKGKFRSDYKRIAESVLKAIKESELLKGVANSDKLEHRIVNLAIDYKFGYGGMEGMKRLIGRLTEFGIHMSQLDELTDKLKTSQVMWPVGLMIRLMMDYVYHFTMKPPTNEEMDEFKKFEKRAYSMANELYGYKVYRPVAVIWEQLLEMMSSRYGRPRGRQSQERRKWFVRMMVDFIKQDSKFGYDKIFDRVEKFLIAWPDGGRPIVFETIRDYYWGRSRKKPPRK